MGTFKKKYVVWFLSFTIISIGTDANAPIPPVCGMSWKKQMYPITRGLLPVTVLIWGKTDDDKGQSFWIGEVEDMLYTYAVTN